MTLNKAFTLIELLIVVAIIGILAAIAVPNFMNAMVRAKIAKVQSDFRCIAQAVETYHIDRNVYPPNFTSGWWTPNGHFVSRINLGIKFLTTPVAYLSPSISLVDPFLKQVVSPDGQGHPYHYMYSASYINSIGFLDFDDKAWILNSIGPDAALGGFLVENSRRNYESYNIHSYPFLTEINRYDSSNSLVSTGDIHLTNNGAISPNCYLIDGKAGTERHLLK